MTDETILEATGVSREYQDGPRLLKVLRGVDLGVRRGESVAITGASGAGKSTLLHLLGGIDRPSHGTIRYDSTELTRLSDQGLSEFCNRSISIVFQFYHLLAEFSALENVMLPGMIAGRPRIALRKQATDLLEAVGLGERISHRPSKMSGGEQQRVAIARALINDPGLILADEPTGNLDPETSESIIQLLWDQTVGRNRTLIIVTHEPAIADRAHTRYHLAGGKLHEETGS